MASYPVWSVPFIQYTPASPNTLFAVPAGYTAVARWGSVSQNIGGYNASWWLRDAEDSPNNTFWAGNSVGIYETAVFEGRVVVPGGGYLGLYFSELGSTPNAYLGGYLLAGVWTPPPP